MGVIKTRDPNKLYNFYNEVTRLHVAHFPNWRAGQFWLNFLSWIQNEKIDLFFLEESNLLIYLKKYCGEENDE